MIQRNRKSVICLVTGAYPKYLVGGSELQLYYTARELIKLGYEVHYTTCEYGQDTARISVDEGIIIHTIRFTIPFFGFLSGLWRALRDADADIYLNRALGYTLATWFFAKLHGRKFIYSVASSRDCIPGRMFPLSLRGMRVVIRDRLNQIGMCRADAIMVQANYQKELLETHFKVNSTVVHNIHPIPRALPEKHDPPVVVWLAGLKRLKQAGLFVELAKQCRDVRCRFVLAGHSSDKGYLDEVLRHMQGVENIEYAGGVTFEQSDELIGQASVLVNTSRYEGFPNTFVQAWMSQVPVVSLNVDPDDILKKRGLGFHSVSLDGMVRDVKRLIEDPELREAIGARAQDYATRHHSMGPNIATIASVFADVRSASVP